MSLGGSGSCPEEECQCETDFVPAGDPVVILDRGPQQVLVLTSDDEV